MDGPRLELQSSKFILLDALAPGNWLGAQSEEKNRVRMVPLYKVEAEEKTYRCTYVHRPKRIRIGRWMPAATEVSEEWAGAEPRLCRHCADEKSSATSKPRKA